jgi:hypothetical protein
MKKHSDLTLAERVAIEQANAEAFAINQERRRRLEEHWKQVMLAEKPIVADLAAKGRNVESVWDLVNMPPNYAEAIPVLLKHLVLPYHDRIREGIARALAVKEAAYAWPTLVSEYRKAPSGYDGDGIRMGTKDALAVALSVTTTGATLGELIALAKDQSQGASRILLLHGLRKSKNPAAKEAIEELASDPDLKKEIASWKRK